MMWSSGTSPEDLQSNVVRNAKSVAYKVPVQKIDMRPQYAFFEYTVRTSDNVELVLEGTHRAHRTAAECAAALATAHSPAHPMIQWCALACGGRDHLLAGERRRQDDQAHRRSEGRRVVPRAIGAHSGRLDRHARDVHGLVKRDRAAGGRGGGRLAQAVPLEGGAAVRGGAIGRAAVVDGAARERGERCGTADVAWAAAERDAARGRRGGGRAGAGERELTSRGGPGAARSLGGSSDPLVAYGYATQSPIAAGAFSTIVRAKQLRSGLEVDDPRRRTGDASNRRPSEIGVRLSGCCAGGGSSPAGGAQRRLKLPASLRGASLRGAPGRRQVVHDPRQGRPPAR